MDNRIKISFVIPCHDLENYISPLIDSFHKLNTANYETEYIFVLDACSDNTEQVIIEKMAPLEYILLKCNHRSCGFARNEGLNYTTGKYIWFLDGDDWIINSEVLQDCIPIMEANNLDIIQIAYTSNYFNKQCNSMVWQYIFTKDLIGDLRFSSIQPNEDFYFMQAIEQKRNTNIMKRYNAPTYYYNYNRPGSNMYQFSTQGFIE